MLIIKIYGVPTHMLVNMAFSAIFTEWSKEIRDKISKYKPLCVKQEQVHVFIVQSAHIPSPPEKLVAEINGSSLRVATRTVSLAEIELVVAKAIASLYPSVAVFASANYSDNS